MSNDGTLDLDRIVFIGRTYEEYLSMFNLTQADLEGRTILDCPGGACSFTAYANKRGADATAADIAYCYGVEELQKKGMQDLEHTLAKMERIQAGFVWDYFKSMDELRKCRYQALTDCINDMKQHPKHYVPATLPVLPFADKQFDMTLSAHLLFVYSDRLDYDFHLKTIQELIRVTKREIRLFPLTNLSGEKYDQLERLRSELHQQGYSTEEIKVKYEFQKGANSMLKITL